VRVYDFSLGEPDFTTPAHICEAATAAMKAGHTHYTPASGVAEVRKAVANWYGRFYNLSVSPDQVVVSNGAKHSIANALAATVGPGDEVVIPSPYWVSYSDLVLMTGAEPKLVPTTFEAGFKMSPEQLQAALTPRTRLVMLNTPSNPTGVVYRREELAALADVILASNDVAVLSDEIYEQLIYDEAGPTCFATLRPGLAERTITVSGASKSYAMTGWRMGWTLSTVPLAKAMANLQSQQTGNPSSISQYALIAALDGPQECVAEMRTAFRERRDLVCQRLGAIPGLRFHVPGGAFYVFIDVSSYFGKTLGGKTMTDSLTFCAAALEQAHVNLVAGSAFGAEGFTRLSFTCASTELEEGLTHLRQWLTGG
jgi:aspartate aminotransferase